MRPDRVVMAPPAFDDDLSFVEGVEDLAIEQLIAKARVEALDVAVLPGAASLNVGGLGTDSRDPFLHRLGDELRSVVGADVSGNAPQDEQVGQNVDHIDRLELAGDTDRQTFVGELVEHGPPLSVGRLDNRRTSLLFKLLLLREHWRRDANRPRFNCRSLRAGLQFLGWRSPQRRNCGDQGRYDYQAGASARRGVEIRRRVAG